mmetsp:Transcript_23217/g.64914  ORF Transcript_23217/g.64914 Transcript_23217/m.64914 type:complete len:213 (+) Transcript_23217:630-1268(+)
MRLNGLDPVVHLVAVRGVDVVEEESVGHDHGQVHDGRGEDVEHPEAVQEHVDGARALLQGDDRVEVVEVDVLLLVRVDVVRHDMLDVPAPHVDAIGERRMGEDAVQPRLRHQRAVRGVVHHGAGHVPGQAPEERDAPHRVARQHVPVQEPHRGPGSEAQDQVRCRHLVRPLPLRLEVVPHHLLEVGEERVVELHRSCGRRHAVLDLIHRQHL